MTLDLDTLVFRARALSQSHPFTPAAYRYLNECVARERLLQPVDQLGIWAGYALTNGYCLRRVEEDDTGVETDQELQPEALPPDLDEVVDEFAHRIRTDGVPEHALYSEELVVEALDRLIAGEIERRLSHWEGTIDDASWERLEEYLARWVIKGYALRVVEQLAVQEK